MTFNQLLYKWGFKLIMISPRFSTMKAMELFERKEIVAVEVGNYKGVNAKNICENLNIKKIYLIDPYTSNGYDAEKEMGAKQKDLDEAKESIRELLGGHEHKIEYMDAESHEAIKYIGEKLDFVYLDGNHEYSYLIQDMRNFWELLKKGGILSGQDLVNKDSVKALFDFCKEKNVYPVIELNEWVIVK